MNCVKVFLFYAFLKFSEVATKIVEKDKTQVFMAPLQKDMNILEHVKYDDSIFNDLEVFKEKLSPRKVKREVESEAEGEEEQKEDETEAEAEPAAEPAVEEEGESTQEAEAEPAAVPAPELEEPNKEVSGEPEAEENLAKEPDVDSDSKQEAPVGEETENVQQPIGESDDIPKKETDESEMPNDEPAKEEEEEEENDKQAESNASHEDETKITKDTNQNIISCFTCKSNDDLKCPIKPTQEVRCPKVNEGDAGKHNGCFTLYQADTNVTMRGCVDELAEAGLKYCLTNEKFCSICYSNGCNNKEAPSIATKQDFNIYLLLLLTISSTIIKNLAGFAFI